MNIDQEVGEGPVEVVVNGNCVAVPGESSIAELLKQLRINHPAIAVELNAEIQTGNRFESTKLRAGDCLEIVSLAGGG